MDKQGLDEFLSADGTRLATAYDNVYDDLCRKSPDEKTKKPFRNKSDLFPVALIIGILYNKRDDTKKGGPFVRFSSVSEQNKNIIKMFIHSVAKGENYSDKWKDIKDLADGGIKIINEDFKKTKEFDVYKFFADANKMWPDRAKEILEKFQESS